VQTQTAPTDAADVLKALADPTRLAIAAMLAREPEALCVCHIEARFALSQPTISHHLRALRVARLVTTERRGTWIHYALDRQRVAAVPGIAALLASIDTSRVRAKACCP
jgi:ArsR family transcriptional regulator